MVLFEWLAGATPGKFMLGIRVRKDTGGTHRVRGSRWAGTLARLIDGLPYVIPYLVGGLAVARSDTRQRLGDRWATTVVIAKGTDAAGAIAPPVPTTEEPSDRATAAGTARFADQVRSRPPARGCDADAASAAGG